MFENDINQILVNGATIALEKMRRANNYESLLFHYAEISVFLEVSLSEGAGISDWSRDTLSDLFARAAADFMDRKRRWITDDNVTFDPVKAARAPSADANTSVSKDADTSAKIAGSK